MDVRTRRMNVNCRLEHGENGQLALVLREGMLPRKTVYELGELLMPVVCLPDEQDRTG